jgi:hypothetical protein
LFVEVLFQRLGTFIHKELETWVQASSEEGGMQLNVASKDGGTSVILEGFGKDCVAVIVIDKQKVVVAIAGWGNKVAGLVSVDLTRQHNRSGSNDWG